MTRVSNHTDGYIEAHKLLAGTPEAKTTLGGNMIRLYDNINMDLILRYNMPTSTLAQRLMAGHCEHGYVS
jgi:hypothetical protein